jgi:hypothetical protein
MGGEEKELRGDAASRLCMDHMVGSRTREVIFSGLALSTCPGAAVLRNPVLGRDPPIRLELWRDRVL